MATATAKSDTKKTASKASTTSKSTSKAADKSASATKAPAKSSTKAADKSETKTASKTAEKSGAKLASKADSKAASKSTSKKSSDSDSKSNTTTDHEEIKAWVEARGGKPSTVKGTGTKKSETGILRIDFPGYSGEDKLQEISWDEFFEKFDEGNLQFLYQSETADGKESRFNKFVSK